MWGLCRAVAAAVCSRPAVVRRSPPCGHVGGAKFFFGACVGKSRVEAQGEAAKGLVEDAH